MKYFYCNRCQVKTISFSCPVCGRRLWLTRIAAAAALMLTTGTAQAMCWYPNHWGGAEENIFHMCEEQERQAQAMEEQLQRQRQAEFDACLARVRRGAFEYCSSP